MSTKANGWGQDPLLRALRALAVVAFLGMLLVVVLDPGRDANNELLVLLFGSTLVALGYPIVMSLPAIFGRSTPEVTPAPPPAPPPGSSQVDPPITPIGPAQ